MRNGNEAPPGDSVRAGYGERTWARVAAHPGPDPPVPPPFSPRPRDPPSRIAPEVCAQPARALLGHRGGRQLRTVQNRQSGRPLHHLPAEGIPGAVAGHPSPATPGRRTMPHTNRDLFVPGGDPRRVCGPGHLPLRAVGGTRSAPLSLSRQTRWAPVPLTVVAVLLIRTLRNPAVEPVRARPRNRRFPPIPPARPARALRGAGSGGGGRPDEDSFRSAAPDGAEGSWSGREERPRDSPTLSCRTAGDNRRCVTCRTRSCI